MKVIADVYERITLREYCKNYIHHIRCIDCMFFPWCDYPENKEKIEDKLPIDKFFIEEHEDLQSILISKGGKENESDTTCHIENNN